MNNFRFKMRKLADEAAQSRAKMTWPERLFYKYPPRLAPFKTILKDPDSPLLFQNGNIVVNCKFENHHDRVVSDFWSNIYIFLCQIDFFFCRVLLL